MRGIASRGRPGRQCEEGTITRSIAIEQEVPLRQEREGEGWTGELAVLATAMAAISCSPEINPVLRSIIAAARTLLPRSTGATVQMPDREGRLVTCAAASALGVRAAPLVFEPGRGVSGVAFAQHATVNVRDVRDDPRFIPGEAAPPYASLLAVPLGSGAQVLGVLCVESEAPAGFSDREERLLAVFARSAAIAIGRAAEHTARLRAEEALERSSERLEAMVEERTAALRAAHLRLVEQQRLEREVALAAEVQASLLPQETPRVPGYDFAGVALAARYVSGDMYGWMSASAEHCSFAIMDIAGKGVAAAMMASTARALLRDRAQSGLAPGGALSSVNRSLYDDLTRAGTFITSAAGSLSQRTASVDYASAGHTEALWYRARGGRCEALPATGPPIGVLPQYDFAERRVLLCPGDVLLFYSDGVTEAESADAELFGTERLIEVLAANAPSPAAALARSVVDAVDAFAKGPRGDDLTLVVVKALPRTIPFRFPGLLERIEEHVALIRTLGDAYGAEFAYELELSASEILTNVVEHACRSSGAEVRGEVHLQPDRVQIDVYDDGSAFDLAALRTRDCSRASERGYGVHITRQLMDEVTYAPRTAAGNHWRLVKTVREARRDER